jgi:Flp pilus assembly protein TadG
MTLGVCTNSHMGSTAKRLKSCECNAVPNNQGGGSDAAFSNQGGRCNSVSGDESGSAVAEFVLLALPLFIPALLFFISLSNSINSEMESSMLAREAVTTFVSGLDDSQAHAKTRLLLNEYEKLSVKLSNSNPNSERINYFVRCEATPCITPGAAVNLTLYINYSINNELKAITQSPAWSKTGSDSISDLNGSRKAIASATAYVDKWR